MLRQTSYSVTVKVTKAAGICLITLAAIQATPWFRRRAIERGMSGTLLFPSIFAAIGLICIALE